MLMLPPTPAQARLFTLYGEEYPLVDPAMVSANSSRPFAGARTKRPSHMPASKAMLKLKPKPKLTASVLRDVARSMLPFYLKIVRSEVFARSFSKAVVKTDLDVMLRLFRLASPKARTAFPGTNGIGYFYSFPFKKPQLQYASGTTIPPGSVQFFFETRVHRAIARAIVPLYRALAGSKPFAVALTNAIRTKNTIMAVRLVRALIPTRTLRSITIEEGGLILAFKFKFSKYTYNHILFNDSDE